jgi:hypothetical protein
MHGANVKIITRGFKFQLKKYKGGKLFENFTIATACMILTDKVKT